MWHTFGIRARHRREESVAYQQIILETITQLDLHVKRRRHERGASHERAASRVSLYLTLCVLTGHLLNLDVDRTH